MKVNQSKKSYTLSELVQGLDVSIQGDAEVTLTGVATIQAAKVGDITFLTNPLYKKYLATTQASVVILSTDEAKDYTGTAVVCRDPHFTYAKIAPYFDHKKTIPAGIHPTAIIGSDCHIDPTASIGPYCVIGDGVKIGAHAIIAASCVVGDQVEIGAASQLDARVTICHHVELGQRVAVASGTVIGSDGFGFARHKGGWQKVPQLGRVIIGDDVDIGANTTIDRGAIDDTVIENGVILDNQIQIGHNVRIGTNTAVAGCVGIAGSAVIGKNCLIGGASCVNGHITVADGVIVTGMTAVSKSIREPGVYSSGLGGLVTNLEWRKTSARLHRIESMAQRIKALEAALEAVTERDKS